MSDWPRRAGIDGRDVLLVVGLVLVTGGAAVLASPAWAALLLGVLLLLLWTLPYWLVRRGDRDGPV